MKQVTQKTYEERILKVLMHIQEHLYEELSLDELAAVSYFSPYHFHRVFKGMVGESVAEYVRRLRLERSAFAITRTQRSITDIGLDTGYENLESFIRAFKERFGMSPSAYRESKKQNNNNDGDIKERNEVPDFDKGGRDMNVKIKRLEPRKVAFIRHTGPYDKCGETWAKLCKWAGPRRLIGFTTKFLGLCYDDPEVTPAEKIRYDACITIKKDIQGEGETGIAEIPGGDYAITVHKGPLEKLGETYAELCGKWLPQSGREYKNRPCVEIYLTNPQRTRPDKMKTEIQLPLE
jgi:AraC family transcriptional regulator